MTSAPLPFIVIKLKPGWLLESAGASVRKRGLRVPIELPAGARLVPALPIDAPHGGRISAAERELARFIHMRLSAVAGVDDALVRAAAWPFVERAEKPV